MNGSARAGLSLAGENYMENQFILTDDKSIVPAAGEASPGAVFSSEAELRRLLREWPLRGLVELWNRLPGVRPVTKFENREVAVARLWRTIQPPPESGEPGAPKARPRRKVFSPPKPGSKADHILTLLQQPHGATLDNLMSATGWQAHSVRGFLSNLKRKRGWNLRSRKQDGQRLYRLGK
jgi:Protein of unknown function (DUF3489)